MWSTAVPCHEDVDKALVSVEFRGDVVFDPLVDGLWRGIYFDLLQQLLLQFHEWEQKAETFPLKNLQHSVFVLVAFYERMEQRKKNTHQYQQKTHIWKRTYGQNRFTHTR